MHTPRLPGASLLARTALALVLGVLTLLLTGTPALAAGGSDSGSGTVSASGPTYDRMTGSCATTGNVAVHYSALTFYTVGNDAPTITMTVRTKGFRGVATLYEGGFLPDYPQVNCYDQVAEASGVDQPITFSERYTTLPAPFTYHQWTLVVAGYGPNDVGTYTADISSSATGVHIGPNPPADTADTTPPVLSLPSDRTVEATSAQGRSVPYTASATDDVDGTVPVSCSRASGSTFPLGSTTVTCAATDEAGNRASGSFTVDVRDTTAPAVTLTAPAVTEATEQGGARVRYDASATDLVDGTVAVTCSPASNGLFPLGATTVTCTARDSRGNVATRTASVTVSDSTAPVVHVPADVAVEASSAAGAPVDYGSVTATDAVTSTPTTSCAPPSGSTFAVGTTTVSCQAADAAGNVGVATFTVTVQDTTGPVVTVPKDRTVEATGSDGAAVDFAVSGSDAVSGEREVSCVRGEGADAVAVASGDTFPLGVSTVTCTSVDGAGNRSSESFTVTVEDTTGPVVTVPKDRMVEATGPDGAAVDFEVSAKDAVSGEREVSCVRGEGADAVAVASGDTFPLGGSTVTCTSVDGAGNSSSTSFDVTVVDTTAPVITTPGDLVVDATGPQGAKVDYEVTARDAVEGDVPVSCTPVSGSLFTVGTTTVACTADDAGAARSARPGLARARAAAAAADGSNTARATFTVTVAPYTAPSGGETTGGTTGGTAGGSTPGSGLSGSSGTSSVAAPSAGALPSTGSSPLLLPALAGALLSLLGGILLVRRRARA